jgi:hypothetical protein
MGFGVGGNYWWQGQNAFSEKQIGELLDSWAKGQARTSGQVFVGVSCFGGKLFVGYFFVSTAVSVLFRNGRG